MQLQGVVSYALIDRSQEMAKKAKGFGVNSHIASNKRKRPGRHSKKHKGKKEIRTWTRFSALD
jgi:hypothetical protein